MSNTEALQAGNLFSVSGKTAFVTGGSRGIGLMIAHAFVANGATVYITSRKAEVCQQTADELSKIGQCVAIPGDLSTDEGRAAVISALSDRLTSWIFWSTTRGRRGGRPLANTPKKATTR